MPYPQVRQQPWYPGQTGVRFSDVQRGLRWEPTGIVLYVDEAHADANDNSDGTNPEGPKLTIQSAVTQLVTFQTALGVSLRGSVIVVAGQDYAESVIIPSTITYCTIMGGGPSRFRPKWGSDSSALPCLTVRGEGWVVDGIEFECPSAASGVRLEEVPGSSYTAYKTVIQNCVFDGLWSGLYGIDFYGAPHRVCVYNNWFVEMNNGGNTAFCIYVTDSSHTNPYQCEIVGNRFMDSDNYVGSLGSVRGFNVSLFQNNVFEDGVLLTPAMMLDLRGGSRGYNIVTGNYFGRAYTNASGYWANATTPDSCWVGNITESTPGTVGDNGMTIRVPA